MIHWVERTESTQNLAFDLASAGAVTGAAVVAKEQSAGRGTKGRQWFAPAGGLWMSVILRAAANPASPVLSLRVGLALAAWVDGILSSPGVCRLKWPNDLILSDRKLAGVLVEGRWSGAAGVVIVGVGLNVDNPLPPELETRATRLRDWGVTASARDVAESVRRTVLAAAQPDGTLDDGEVAAFEARDWLRGRPVRGAVDGIAAGVGADGRLVVISPDGGRHLVLGGIEAADLAPSDRPH